MKIYFMLMNHPYESISEVFIDPMSSSAVFLARSMRTNKIRKVEVDDIENSSVDMDRELFERKMRRM